MSSIHLHSPERPVRPARLAPWRSDEVEHAYRAGVPLAELAQRAGVSVRTLRRALRRAGVTPRARAGVTLDPALVDAYRAGVPLAELAQRAGVSVRTLRRALRRAGVTPRARAGVTLDPALVDAYRAGVPLAELAQRAGVSVRTLRRAVQQAGLSRLSSVRTMDADQIRALAHQIRPWCARVGRRRTAQALHCDPIIIQALLAPPHLITRTDRQAWTYARAVMAAPSPGAAAAAMQRSLRTMQRWLTYVTIRRHLLDADLQCMLDAPSAVADSSSLSDTNATTITYTDANP